MLSYNGIPDMGFLEPMSGMPLKKTAGKEEKMKPMTVSQVLSVVAAFLTGAIVVGGTFAVYYCECSPKRVPHALESRFDENIGVNEFYEASDPLAFQQIRDMHSVVKPLVVAQVQGDSEPRLWWGTESYPAPLDAPFIYLAYPRECSVSGQVTMYERRPIYIVREQEGDKKIEYVQLGSEKGPAFSSIQRLNFVETRADHYERMMEDGHWLTPAVQAIGDPLYLGLRGMVKDGKWVSREWSVVWGKQILATYGPDKRFIGESLGFVMNNATRCHLPIYSYEAARDGELGIVTVLDGQESFLPFQDQPTMPPIPAPLPSGTLL